MELYKVSILNQEGTSRHSICICPKDQIGNIIKGYQKLYDILSGAHKSNDLWEFTDDLILCVWDQGHIIAKNIDTGEKLDLSEHGFFIVDDKYYNLSYSSYHVRGSTE
tara:strand:- start:130 stop:453 length:324 start_codon:yes stop_codon:yes gene_type:complete